MYSRTEFSVSSNVCSSVCVWYKVELHIVNSCEGTRSSVCGTKFNYKLLMHVKVQGV